MYDVLCGRVQRASLNTLSALLQVAEDVVVAGGGAVAEDKRYQVDAGLSLRGEVLPATDARAFLAAFAPPPRRPAYCRVPVRRKRRGWVGGGGCLGWGGAPWWKSPPPGPLPPLPPAPPAPARTWLPVRVLPETVRTPPRRFAESPW